ncbi:MAG: 50S ribosomal protein L3 [candidate division BRC1 bacterium ADurb.BinA364]|nr:MAG: 50S ribosomal protein L3 [candidate division BRC1 bacterium ADurb.BinA364]
MTIGLLGKKLGMTQIFDENGISIPVTLIEAGPCPILQKKTAERDGYNALQLGFGQKKKSNAAKPLLGHLRASGAEPPRLIKEFRMPEPCEQEVGNILQVDMFAAGEMVDVTGISKGRGYAGPMKRHGSARGPETHGSKYHRRTGSLGQSAWPSHVYKGKPMAGQMGAERSTIQNLIVIEADKERNLLVVKGSVPGHNNGFVVIRKAIRVRKAKSK